MEGLGATDIFVILGELDGECTGVKSLTNHAHGFRLRVGNYPVLFDFDRSIKLVRIEQVGKRNERTY